MSKRGEDCWVTFAGDEEDGRKALVLAQSLRRVKTKKKICIIVGFPVTQDLWEHFEIEFDSIIPLEKDEEVDFALSFEQRAKLGYFKVNKIQFALLTNPDTFFLENCDEMFDSAFGEIHFDGELEGKKSKDGMDYLKRPIIAIKNPSTESLLSILKAGLVEKDGHPLTSNFIAQNEKLDSFVSKHGLNLDMEKNAESQWLKREEDVKFVNFFGKHPFAFEGNDVLSVNCGSLEKFVFELWNELYSNLRIVKEPAAGHIMSGIIPVENKLNKEIAIVGMSCRFPGSNDVDEFWSLLLNKGDGIGKVPKDRWLAEQCPNLDSDAMNVQAGFLKCPVDEFDGKFFGMSPMELSFTDPQQRFLLELSWEALEDAAINPHSLKDSATGIFTGTWTQDYNNLMNESGSSYNEFFRSYIGNSFGATAGKMAHFYETIGSNIATESGCSSSMVAVGLACESLRRKRTNLALACGVNLLLKPFTYKDWGAFISPDGHCKTFDAKADGFGRAEGVGILVLKRLSDAVKDGDRIHAVIRGYGEAQEGPSKSLGTPTVAVEALAMRIALADAEVEPNEVQFVEAHGTGTAVGDPMEMKAICQVYSKDRKEPLYVGSVKTNVGHTESCSGITGIIKTVLALKNETIPPHRALEKLNPKIDIQKTPAIIPMEPIAWKRTKGIKRLAGVSSFGITGTDTHLILEEAPIPKKFWSKAKGKFPLNILAISAKSEDSLQDSIKAYTDHLKLSRVELKDVAFTANTGRAHFNSFRAAIIGKDCAEVVKKIGKESFVRSVSGSKPKLCFVFTGQGSQYHKMGKTLYENAPEFRKQFDLCDEILTKTHGIQIREVIWGEKESTLLHRTLYSQTSIFCIEYCLTKLWESWGIIPDTVLAHSLGEFAASCAAGILSLNDALNLVAERSKLIDALPPGKMIVIKAGLDQTNNLLEKLSSERKDFVLDIAAINSPDQTALAGSIECIEAFKSFCEINGIKSHVLESTHAFHSREMEPMLSSYRKVAEGINYRKPICEFISGMEGKLLSNVNSEYWVRNTRESVNFVGASKAVYAEGCRAFLEIGPQPVLSAFIQTNLASQEESFKCIPSLRKKQDEWETILTALASLYVHYFDINWANFYKHIPTQKVSLPFYQFQRKKYWFELSKIGKASNKFGGKELHPLIGCAIPNATNTRIFKGNLDMEKETWVKDHVVGKNIIFPGAGLLEMALASGHAASTVIGNGDFHLPLHQIELQNLEIESPLGIKEDELCEMQTIICPQQEEDSNSNKVIIYKYQIDGENPQVWKRYASANSYSFFIHKKPTDYQNDFESFKTSFTKEIDISTFYQQLEKVGLNFGPSFQSLKRMWINKKRDKLIEIQVPVQDDKVNATYLCHPVIIDAMIQATMIKENVLINSLFVPIFIRRFVWFGKNDVYGIQKNNYIHVAGDEDDGDGDDDDDDVKSIGRVEAEEGEVRATLYSNEGRKLAFIQGVTLIETTLDKITNALETQKVMLPRMMEEIWKANSEHSSLYLNEHERFLSTHYVKELSDCVEINESLPQIELADQKILDEIVSLYGMKSFIELGFNPIPGDKIQIQSFINQFGITQMNKLLVRRFFEMLVEDDICSQIGPMEFTILKKFPLSFDISNRIKLLSAAVQSMRLEVSSLIHCSNELTGVLQGKEDILSILFSPGDSESLAERIYKEFKGMIKLNELLSRTMGHVLDKWIINKLEGKELKILEIGAGTGSATKTLLPILTTYDINYSYTFTDLSPMFLHLAESTFSIYKHHMEYKVLDIEKDPKSQGFPPYQFDIIVALNVLHATKSLSETLQNVRHLIKPSGLVFIAEQIKTSRLLDGIFGLVEGFWRFNDFHIRPYHSFMDENKWAALLKKTGFTTSTIVKVTEQNAGVILAQASNQIEEYTNVEEKHKTWILFIPNKDCKISNSIESQLKLSGRNVIQVIWAENKLHSFEGADVQNELKQEFQSLIEFSGEIEGFVYLWGLGKEIQINFFTLGYLYLIQSVLSTPKFVGMNVFPKIYVFTEGVVNNIGDQEAGSPLGGTLWGMSRSLRSEHPTINVKCVDLDPSLHYPLESKANQAFTELWNEDQEYLVAYRNGIRHVCRLTDTKIQNNPLPFMNNPRFSCILPSSKTISDIKFVIAGRPELQRNMIEIQVKTAGLNFRDLICVLKPVPEFDKANTIGADFSGIVTSIGPDVKCRKIGEAVIGCNFQNKPLSSYISLVEDLVIPFPSGMTFAEGSTLPIAFCTVYHCPIDIGYLQKGEKILIHTASGGVGLVAIQVAKDIGANIIATAGSRKKRAYLRSLGLEHVFHSRDLSFGSEIKRVTGGKGVQMVLNSLTSPGFKEASLEACAPKARFVEMSKFNIWTEEEVKNMRPDVIYKTVDLNAVSVETWKFLFSKLNKYLLEGRVSPIQYVRFDCVEIRQALTYLQQAKHIGKIVCIMPEVKLVDGQWETKYELFNDQSTYLITGGFGGIGFETAKWMGRQGAKHIVLCGRNPPTQYIQDEIILLNNSKMNLIPMQLDIGKLEDCKQLLKYIQTNLPPLRGIQHVAGSISDGLFENQTKEKYAHTFNSKVNGSLNLHELTKVGYRLEHFVLYSSIVSIFGQVGQSNHAASCAFLDCLAQYRVSIGLPGTSINWGHWGQIGVAANIHSPVCFKFTPFQGFSALELILKSYKPQVTVLKAEISKITKINPWIQNNYAKEITIPSKKINSDKIKNNLLNTSPWEEFKPLSDKVQTQKIISNMLKNIIISILRLESSEEINYNQNFQNLGLDSLMTVELKNRIQKYLGSKSFLSSNIISEFNTINLLSNVIIDLLEESQEKDLTKEQLNIYITQESILPNLILLSKEFPQLKDISKVLLILTQNPFSFYLLEQFCSKSQIQLVYCILPLENWEKMKLKFLNGLEASGISQRLELNMNKIEFIHGNINKPQFGMQSKKYNCIAEEVQLVISISEKEDNSDKTKEIRKETEEIKNIISFVADKSIKWLVHISTLFPIGQKLEPCAKEFGFITESWPIAQDITNYKKWGYSVSRFILDRLFAQAAQLGIPCKIFRIPYLAGDSRTGYFELNNNHVFSRFISFMKMGIEPQVINPFCILPIDFTAQIIIQICLELPFAPIGLYNLTNSHKYSYTDLFKMTQELCNDEENNGTQNSIIAAIKHFYGDLLKYSDKSFANILEPQILAHKVNSVIPNFDELTENQGIILKKDFIYAHQVGLLNKFGVY